MNIINKFIDNITSFINSNTCGVLPCAKITIQDNVSANDVIGVRLQPEQFQSVLSQIEVFIYDISKDAMNSRMKYTKLLEANNELICNNPLISEANSIITRNENALKSNDGIQRYYERKFGAHRCDTFGALEQRLSVLEKKMQRVSNRNNNSNRNGNGNSGRHYLSTNVSLNQAFSLHDNNAKPKSSSKSKFKHTTTVRTNSTAVKSAAHKQTKKKKRMNKTANIEAPLMPNTSSDNKHTRNYNCNCNRNNSYNKRKAHLN